MINHQTIEGMVPVFDPASTIRLKLKSQLLYWFYLDAAILPETRLTLEKVIGIHDQSHAAIAPM
jgi:hypothetical protein